MALATTQLASGPAAVAVVCDGVSGSARPDEAASHGRDPGVSHLHAVLLAEPDGGWAVLDPGSANGTMVNGRETAAGQRVPLRDGDRIYVGAWTVLTIRAG